MAHAVDTNPFVRANKDIFMIFTSSLSRTLDQSLRHPMVITIKITLIKDRK